MSKSLDVISLHKEMSREKFGSPRRTFKRSSRKGGTSRQALDLNLNSYSPMLHLSEREESLEGAPRLAKAPALIVNAIEIRKRSYNDRAPLVHYSQEVITHANMLLQTKGATAVAAYLKGIKEHTMSHTDLARTLSEQKEQRQVLSAHGAIETALAEAKEKVAYHHSQIAFHQAEETRWQTVADNLKNVINISNGPAQASKNGNGHSNGNGNSTNKRPHGFWDQEIKVCLSSGKPMRKTELVKSLRDRVGCDISVVYPAVSNAIKKGMLIDLGSEQVGLTEWTEPNKAVSVGAA